MIDDQALWLNTPAGLVIVLGCGHAGLINTVTHLRAITGIRRIAGIIGGLHLLHASAARIDHTLALLIACRPDFMWLGHCTGSVVINRFRQALPQTDVRDTYAGAHWSIPLAA